MKPIRVASRRLYQSSMVHDLVFFWQDYLMMNRSAKNFMDPGVILAPRFLLRGTFQCMERTHSFKVKDRRRRCASGALLTDAASARPALR